MLAEIMATSPQVLEGQYLRLPLRNSPLDSPMTPARVAAVAIPLHPGAAAFYARRSSSSGT